MKAESAGNRAVREEKSLPDDERPPLGSWRRMYALVLGNLTLLIALFYAFTLYFD